MCMPTIYHDIFNDVFPRIVTDRQTIELQADEIKKLSSKISELTQQNSDFMEQ